MHSRMRDSDKKVQPGRWRWERDAASRTLVDSCSRTSAADSTSTNESRPKPSREKSPSHDASVANATLTAPSTTLAAMVVSARAMLLTTQRLHKGGSGTGGQTKNWRGVSVGVKARERIHTTALP